MSFGNERAFIDHLQDKEKGGRAMKCPLFIVGNNAQPDPEQVGNDDCLKEECGWWEREGEGCAMPLIALRLGTIAEVLNDIEAKMPHEEQFRN